MRTPGLLGLAAGAALAVAGRARQRQARSDARARAAEGERAALRRVAAAVARGDRPEYALAVTAREAAGLLGVEAGFVIRFDGDSAVVMGVFGEPSPTGARFALLGEGALPRVARTGLSAEVYAQSRPLGRDNDGRWWIDAEYRGGAAAPVFVGEMLWGAVMAGTTRDDPLPPDAVRRLERFAELAGMAVGTAEARERLASISAADPLTGLANHRAFQERLAVEVERALKRGDELSLMLCDLDHFRLLNDLHGHRTGDRVLVEVASRLSAEAEPGQLVARVGGEEFAWLMPGVTGQDALAAAQRARAVLATIPLPGVARLTASAGVCDLRSARGAAELHRLTGGALYWAKAHGRNTAVLYRPEVVEALSADDWAPRLERARVLAGVRALARAVDAKDALTRDHSERVADLAARLARAGGWSPERAALLREAGLLHDLGKIGVPDAILLKPDRLTEEEYEAIKAHADLGARIVGDVLTDEQVSWIRHHHERWDGRGYPAALGGADIPAGARILALADAWDAMVSRRSYATPRSAPDAMQECRRQAGRQFCPSVVGALVRLWAADPAVLGGDEVSEGAAA